MHLKREPEERNDLSDQLIVYDGSLSLESLDYGGIDEEFTVSEDALMHTLTILLALLLLYRVDCDALELRSELVIDLESVLLGDRLLDSSLRLRHLTLTFAQVNLSHLVVTLAIRGFGYVY